MAKKKENLFFRILLVIFVIIFGLIVASNTAISIKTIINYNHNVLAWKEYNHSGIINDQEDFENLYYGFGTVAKNGCGAVSVYNILCMENKNPDFPKIIREFDFGGENLFGLGGTNPFRIITVLSKNGFKVQFSLNKNKFESIAKNCKYAIYLYFGTDNSGIFGHYQLMHNFDGEKFDTINITGKYTYQEITNIQNTFFTMMIGVN